MATMSEVAERAGVSLSTVSYAISGARPISPATRARVMEAIRDLDFTPHAGARSIRRRRSGVIGLVMPLIYGEHSHVQMPFVMSILEAADDLELNLMMLTADDDMTRVRELVNSSVLDGLIVMEVEAHDTRLVELRKLSRPVILLGTPASTSPSMTSVDFDFASAGSLLAHFLADEGHASVLYVGQAPTVFERGISFATSALDQFGRAAQERGMAVTERPVTPTPLAVESALDEMFAEAPEASAICVFNEQALPLVMQYLAQRGRAVPSEISVVAICPDEIADAQIPQTTAVTLPAEDLARLAVEKVRSAIDGERRVSRTLLVPELKVRRSSR